MSYRFSVIQLLYFFHFDFAKNPAGKNCYRVARFTTPIMNQPKEKTMTIKTELNKAAETSRRAGQLAFETPAQAKIWTIFAVLVYSSVFYTFYRATRGGVKLARRSK